MSELHNPWRQFIENCISGDNYFRASEYHRLLDQMDGWIAEIAALRAQVEALSAERDAALNRSSDLMATNGRLRQQIEAFRDQVAGDCL